jgi:hypothetical protein
MPAAAEALGWHKGDLARAVAISLLPSEVLRLFEGKPLSYAHGDVLLKVHDVIGTAEMIDRAAELLSQPKRRTVEQVIAHLLKVKEESGIELKVRKDRSRRGTRFVFEFSIEARQADDIIASGEQLAPIILMVLSMIRSTRKAKERSHSS